MALDPLRFHIEGAAPAAGDWTPVMNAALSALVEHNLRARLSQSPPLVGSHRIELAIVPDAPPASLRVSDGLFEIPAAEGSGIDHLVKAAGGFPIREIGDNVRAITEHLKTLIASPRIEDSIIHLDDALVHLDQTLREAGPKVAPTIQSPMTARAAWTVPSSSMAVCRRLSTVSCTAPPQAHLVPYLYFVPRQTNSIGGWLRLAPPIRRKNELLESKLAQVYAILVPAASAR